MDKRCFLCLVLAVSILQGTVSAQGKSEVPTAKGQEITVYAYDSFTSEWGPGPIVVPQFEQKTGIKVNLVSLGSGGELLQRLELERDNPKADIVIGISNGLLHAVAASDLFVSYQSPVLSEIPRFLHFDPEYRLLPFDYGNYAFVYDSQKVSDPPTSLEDLLDPKWKKKVILMDPRTSSVGMGLLEWTIAAYGDDYLSWWKAMEPNILTIADSWSSGYGLFTEGEAPLVISYTTSPVYHVMYENTDRYKALVFTGGNAAVIEGMGILKSTTHLDAARQFVDFLLTDAQVTIATANSMYPVNATVQLPAAFDYAPKPNQSLMLDAEIVAKNRETWLTGWVEAMSR